MKSGLLELGSLVLDVDGNTLTGTFLNSLVQTTDTFTIVKGAASCPGRARAAPRPRRRSSSLKRDDVDDTRDRIAWNWRPARPGSSARPPGRPTSRCASTTRRAGSSAALAARRGGAERAAGRRRHRARLQRRDATSPACARLKPRGVTGNGQITRRAAAGLGAISLPVALPVTAQLVNLDGGDCWEAVFTTAKSNGPTKLRMP